MSRNTELGSWSLMACLVAGLTECHHWPPEHVVSGWVLAEWHLVVDLSGRTLLAVSTDGLSLAYTPGHSVP